jgi:GNAT superfamily N-acetyltransferase
LSADVNRAINLGELKIRPARKDDAAALAQLADELEHPTTPEQVAERFTAATQQNTYALIVAEVPSGELAGFVELVVERLIDAEPRVDVAGLVVSDAHRGLGIGRILMAYAEKWATERGCRIVHLRSNSKRAGAHAFYERLGYEHFKTQKAFRKILQ